MHQIENNYLKIRARESGAELTSLFDKKHNIEHLWQADPGFWAWHAPVLFPVVGRCMNDELVIDGRKYPMVKHGFARNAVFSLLELGSSRMVFSLKWNDELLKVYPYRFEFLIGYRLNDNRLTITYEVVNRDDKNVYFQVGGHPAFAVPFLNNEDYGDYYLEFERSEEANRHYINEDGYFDGRTAVAVANSNTIGLKPNMFRDDALIFKSLQSRRVTIRSKNHPHYVSVDFNGFNYLGLWAKMNAPYVCIEPWLGCADTAGAPVDIKEREGIVALPPAGEFSVSYNIEVG
ncbi:MAG TPA: aldose 1-epimerase family protein [Chitinophagales bacterium]|nr:aldose 1-epimerase family protein [Chitinophagales bacterium]